MVNKIWARIDNGVVAELCEFDEALVPGEDVPALWTDDVTAIKDVAVGWIKANNGSFTAPRPPAISKADLLAYAAQARYLAEISGVSVAGAKIATDRDSQSLINGAYCATVLDDTFTTSWKGADGSWKSLDAAGIKAVAQAVSGHVKACFAAEQDAAGKIASGAITTTAQIDTAMASIP